MASWPASPNLLGKRTRRVDGPLKASGRAKYTYDIIRPGMTYGRVLRSPHPHARVVAIDLSEARRAPGVRAAIAIVDLASPEPLTHKVLFQGQEVAAVAADTEEQAADAVRLVRVQYEPLPHLTTVEQAMRPEAPQVFPDGNVREANLVEEGTVDVAMAGAAHIVEGVYSTEVVTHTALETHGLICEWNGENLTAFCSTQAVHSVRDGLARSLGIPQANIRVVTDYMGGGFGAKLGSDNTDLVCAKLAREAGRPVKLMLDRKEEHLVRWFQSI